MKAAWYERQGPARDVLIVGEMKDPSPRQGEVRIRVSYSGINPGDVKKRQDTFGIRMPYSRVIPHSDGSGYVDQVGEGVPSEWTGRRVWCFGAQSCRPFGTAAEYTVVPVEQAVPLGESAPLEQGACIGIPGITGHRAVHVAGPVDGKTVLVQGGAVAVGVCAVHLAHRAGARVIAIVRSDEAAAVAASAGADHVVLSSGDAPAPVRDLAPDGVDHIVEVAFGGNIGMDSEVLAPNGSIATYASNDGSPSLPFWQLVFKNVRTFFLGSDDFPPEAKARAATDLTQALEDGWSAFDISERLPLKDVARAHELVEGRTVRGRVVLALAGNETP